jgi:dipeptide/tripeptide permease
MVSLLALFLCADRAGGGFAWNSKAALTLVGAFSGLMYATPVVGGWVADRLLDHRLALLIGGSLMVAGYVLIVLAAIAARNTGLPYRWVFSVPGCPLSQNTCGSRWIFGPRCARWSRETR